MPASTTHWAKNHESNENVRPRDPRSVPSSRLHQAGLHVTSGEGEFAALKLRPYRTKGGHTTVLIHGKGPSQRFKSVPVNDEHLLYAVFPGKDGASTSWPA